jgi:hypothetical protein
MKLIAFLLTIAEMKEGNGRKKYIKLLKINAQILMFHPHSSK